MQCFNYLLGTLVAMHQQNVCHFLVNEIKKLNAFVTIILQCRGGLAGEACTYAFCQFHAQSHLLFWCCRSCWNHICDLVRVISVFVPLDLHRQKRERITRFCAGNSVTENNNLSNTRNSIRRTRAMRISFFFWFFHYYFFSRVVFHY